MVTRGETDRLSADSMLKYFNPLLLWLKVQNRDESVIGWNTNVVETSLFQSLYNGCKLSDPLLILNLVVILILKTLT